MKKILLLYIVILFNLTYSYAGQNNLSVEFPYNNLIMDVGYPDSMYGYNFRNPKDSVPTSKEIYVYDVMWNRILKESYTYDSFNGGQWLDGIRNTNTYTAGKLVESRLIKRENYTNIWKNFQKTDYVYHKTGSVYIKTLSYWDDSLQWYNKQKDVSFGTGDHYFYTSYLWNLSLKLWIPTDSVVQIYDTSAYPVQSYTYKWDPASSVWMNYKKEENFRDKALRRNIGIWYFWNNSIGWKKTYKFEGYIKSNGTDSIYYVYEGKSDNSGWDTTEKYTYYYDAKNRLIIEIDYVKDNSFNIWNKLDKYEFRYDAFGRENYSATYSWVNTTWEGNEHYTLEFNSKGKEIHRLIYVWNDQKKDWDTSKLQDNVYDTSGSKLLTCFYNYDNYYYTFILKAKTRYFYPDSMVVGLIERNSEKLRIYPNPASDQVYFEFKSNNPFTTMYLFNAKGELIRSESVRNGWNVLDLSLLPAGMYYIKIEDQQKIYTGKVLKQ
jgi:hypothetical protein